ncbi:hypothetical protein MRB53_040770 [Persea americana]|nr:hypothetical protein MRB53_040770 [Persea americana]
MRELANGIEKTITSRNRSGSPGERQTAAGIASTAGSSPASSTSSLSSLTQPPPRPRLRIPSLSARRMESLIEETASITTPSSENPFHLPSTKLCTS